MGSAQAILAWPGPFGLSDRERQSGATTSTASNSESLSWAELSSASVWGGVGLTGRVRLTGRSYAELPKWAVQAATDFAGLLNLQEGWNSYASRPVDRAIVQAAWDLLSRMMRDTSPSPAIVPTNPGGVQLEWHTECVDLEIALRSPFNCEVYFEDVSSNVSWEGPLPDIAARLERAIAMLSTQTR